MRCKNEQGPSRCSMAMLQYCPPHNRRARRRRSLSRQVFILEMFMGAILALKELCGSLPGKVRLDAKCMAALERCAKKREAAAQAAREILNSIKPSTRKLCVQRRLRLRRLVCKHTVRARTADRALSAAALYGAYTRPYLRCGSKADRLILKHSCVEHRISKNSCTDLWLFNVTWCGLLS